MAQKITLEQTFDKLEETIEKLEAEDISLEESFALYKQGIQLIKECNDKISKVEKQVLVLNEDGELNEF